ncbi:hypothetical protein PLICRDRAFT_53516 [Plicaturopsis crispa FD-325 SS-3]|nr:hypothetical protein PLICRDRAFT_53516 [Plicaturopsis crispa FD-325 SS-3]
MDSHQETPICSPPRAHTRPVQLRTNAVAHQYGTRIRRNSVIKPSARLRGSPDPPPPIRKVKPAIMPKSMPAASSSSSERAPLDMPQFPPPHVMLHPDDANSKVFLAVGRSFLSVDNRAMTIKDLADMTMKFGLICQNASAAGQAITTYIRNHLQRCEAQQDHPLLLRHILSGTPSDDDLLPALHSRAGGAHCPASTDRLTNFRRGTMVWYLSKAAGAPCPFYRAGIRLCEYGENGRVGEGGLQEGKKARARGVEMCGQKRKRVLRGRGDRERGSGTESAEEEEKRPPKVKLTLKLRPHPSALRSGSSTLRSSSSTPSNKEVIDLSKSEDSEDMSVDSSSSDEDESAPPAEAPWSLPPYPRGSISIPTYTPTVESAPPLPMPSRSAGSPMISSSAEYAAEPYRRSPSVAFSAASPPPDSEDEDDDYHITMTGSRRFSSGGPARRGSSEWDPDFDSGSEGDADTQWESPGPRSPSAPYTGTGHVSVVKQEDARVKQEVDVQGMLEAWEDRDRDSSAKVIEVVQRAAAAANANVKKIKVEEELDGWSWDTAYGWDTTYEADWRSPQDEMHIKQEEFEPVGLEPFYAQAATPGSEYDDPAGGSPLTPLSALSPASEDPGASDYAFGRRHSELTTWKDTELTWKDAELLGPDSIQPQEFEDGEWQGVPRARGRANTAPDLSLVSSSAQASSYSFPSTSTSQPPREFAASSPSTSSSLGSVPALSPGSDNAPSPGPDYASPGPQSVERSMPLQRADATPAVIVHTCAPCTPTVTATEVEGIPVYCTTLGTSVLMRRLDTDFVNLSPMVAYVGVPMPADVVSRGSATVVSQGSAAVKGTWVPLAVAQAFAREYTPVKRVQIHLWVPADTEFARKHTEFARKHTEFARKHTESVASAPAESSARTPTRTLPDGLLDIFLSDALVKRFPPALQDFYRASTPRRLLNQFGPHFKSTADASRTSGRVPASNSASTTDARDHGYAAAWDRHSDWGTEDHYLSFAQSFPIDIPAPAFDDAAAVSDETPLSPTEQEMFQALCALPEWEKETTVAGAREEPPACEAPSAREEDVVCESMVTDAPHQGADAPREGAEASKHSLAADDEDPQPDLPLRRSKRVAVANANAIAAQARTSRSRKRGSRSTLS